MTEEQESADRRNVFGLIGDLPRLLTNQVRSEMNLVKAQLKAKAMAAAAGVFLGLLAVAVLVLGFVSLLLAGIFALGQVMPNWAAALVMAGVFVLVGGLIGIAAAGSFKGVSGPVGSRALREPEQPEQDAEAG